MDRTPAELLTTVIDGRRYHVFADGRIRPVLHGAADDGEPTEVQVPDDLSTLDEATARELHAALEARFAEQRAAATTPAQVEALRQIRATQAKLAERVSAIHAEAAQVESALGEVDAPVALPDAPAANAGGEGANAPAGTEEPTVPGAEDKPGAAPAGTATMPAAVAAGAGSSPTAGLTPGGVAGQRPAQTAAVVKPSNTPARPRASYIAAAGQTVVQQGVEVDFERIGAMADSAKSRLDGNHGEVQAFIAGLPAFEEHGASLGVEVLSANVSVRDNDRMIREAVEDWRVRSGRADAYPAGRTAAICDPLDIIREIPDCSTDADPFGDSLPQRPAGRLGFQFTPAILMSAIDGGVQAGWDDADQALVDPADVDTWKPCVDITCPTPTNVRAEAVTACVKFDVTTEMSNPERVQDVLSKLAALRTRKRTVRLLAITDALSSHYTFASQFGYGAFPALIEASMSVIARAVYAERINQGDYNIYLPPGLVEMLATDLIGRAYGQPEEIAQAQTSVVNMIESITGLSAVRLLDDSAGNPFAALPAVGGGGVALPRLNELADLSNVRAYTVRFIAPEAALYFSTGEERTGIEASPELMRQNKRQWFSEEFVGLAKHGCHPWFRVDMTLCQNGARTGFNAPVACADPTP